jgi:GNAT superfamily N-acetyltransferase
MRVVLATDAQFGGFLELAAEVEDWFGAMVEEQGFHDAVRRNIARGSALAAVDRDRLVGGLLFSHHRAPRYEVSWLVVSAARRSEGVGRELLAEAVRRWVRPPGVIGVVTFGADHPGARSRKFYERLGFKRVAVVEPGPDGGSRERFELSLEALPNWA